MNVSDVKAQRFSYLMILICIISLLLMPLFPWIGTGSGDDARPSHESQIIVGGEQIEELIDDYNGDKDSDYYKGMKATVGLKNNLSGIGFFLWLVLIFAIIIMFGIKIGEMGNQYNLISNIFKILGLIVLIFSILILLNHIFFLGDLGEANDKLNADSAISFGFIISMILSLILLLVSLAFTAAAVPQAIRGFTGGRPRPMPQQGYQQPPMQQQRPPVQQQPPQPTSYQAPPPTQPAPTPQPTQQQAPPAPAPVTPPTQGPKFCAKCGHHLKGNPKFCPKCGNKIS